MKFLLSVFNAIWVLLCFVVLLLLIKMPHILIMIFGPALAFILPSAGLHLILWKINRNKINKENDHSHPRFNPLANFANPDETAKSIESLLPGYHSKKVDKEEFMLYETEIQNLSFFKLVTEGDNAGKYQFQDLHLTQSSTKKASMLSILIEDQYKELLKNGEDVIDYGVHR